MKVDLTGFKVRGSSASGEASETGKKILELLENLPENELVTTRELSRLIGRGIQQTQRICREEPLAENRYFVPSSGFLFGSKRAIKELRRRNKDKSL